MNRLRHRSYMSGGQRRDKAVQDDRQGGERAEAKGKHPATRHTDCRETYLDVRICCTCWGVRAKVKCASSNRWLELDAEDTKGSYSQAPCMGSAGRAPFPGS